MASPPAWLLAVLAAPHAFGLLPLLAPRQLASVAARLGHTDAAVPFTAGSLVLGCCQAAALMQFLVDSRAAGSEEALSSAALPFAVRAALATPLLIGGVALKLGALRLSRVHFGKQPGSRECAAPLSREFPYTLTAHPDYSGSALLLLAGGALILGAAGAPPGGLTVLLFWLSLHALSAMAEEGYWCAGDPPQPAKRPDQNPFWDNVSRQPENMAERCRQLLMAPVALLRCCIFWVCVIAYGLLVNALNKAYKGDERRIHALLVPVTQMTTTFCLWCCGFTLSISGGANLAAAQRAAAASNSSFEIVVNHLSYMDIMVCAAVFGPYAAVARHDLLDWPVIGPVARAWGVMGVVQSDIREKELSADTKAPPAEDSSGAEAKPTPRGGRAAVLAARASLPGSGWALPPVLVFPEGTTTGGGCLIAFRSGAFVGGVPVLPVALRYSAPSGLNLCWGAPHSTGSHFWKTQCAWGKRVDIQILPLHTPTPAEATDAHTFAEAVRGKMAAALNWPALSGYSVREAHALMHELSQGGGPLSRAAAAAAASTSASGADDDADKAPAAALPPLPPLSSSPVAPLAARHRGGSGSELFPPPTGPAVTMPDLAARASSSPDSRRRGKCPSPKQVHKQA